VSTSTHRFSLKRGLDEGLTEGQLARVQAWEAALISVIKQEMLHLALATNILTAIGAAPHFERPNFPILSRWYPPGVQIALVPFGERALRHFIYLERPEGMALDDAAGFAAVRHAQPLTVGDAELVAVPSNGRRSVTSTRPVEPAFVRLPPDVDSGTLIEDPATAQVADLANGLYEVILQVLSRYYIHHGETAAEFDTLARTAKHLMNWVMRELGPVLTALPVGPSDPGQTAGPTFDIVRPAIFVLPHQDAAWKIIKERLDALERACASLGQQAGLEALAPLAGKLQSMSQDIGAYVTKTAD
jgi:hypothetical protein